jgi:hypothetical protein
MKLKVEGTKKEIDEFVENFTLAKPWFFIKSVSEFHPNDSREQPFSKANEGTVFIEIII